MSYANALSNSVSLPNKEKSNCAFNGVSYLKKRTTTISVKDALSRIEALALESKTENLNGYLEDLCINTELLNETPETLAKIFFKDMPTTGTRLMNGIVETPSYIADKIVLMAAEAFLGCTIDEVETSELTKLSWYDPCVGAGAFPLSILNLYNRHFMALISLSELPTITFSDISPSAVFLTLCSLRLLLRETPVSLEDYIASGKLSYFVADTLTKCGEGDDLLSPPSACYSIVVGNPPYVRANRLSADYKKYLKFNFPNSFYGSADLFTYFIAGGICSLGNGGVLAFISPASFLRTKNGTAVRAFIQDRAALIALIDFDETGVFNDADVHAAIYVLKKNYAQPASIQYAHIKSLDDLNRFQDGTFSLKSAAVDLDNGNGWAFHKSSHSLSRFNDTYNNCRPLIDFGITVYSGIRSGFAKAFILEEEQVEKFSVRVRNEWIKPIALAADIRRWQGMKAKRYMIFIPRETAHLPEEIETYLRPYQEILSSRPEVKSISDWYKLRSCSYYEKMLMRKIVFPDLSAHQRFSMCEAGVLVADGAYFLNSDNIVLLGILNSNTAKEYFTHRCASVGNLNGKGRFRFKKGFLQEFPLPSSFESGGRLYQEIESVMEKILLDGEEAEEISVLDNLVADLYGAGK